MSEIPSEQLAPPSNINEFSLIKDVKDKLVAVLDVDGTLMKPYTITRFAQFLKSEGIGNQAPLDRLLRVIDAKNDGEYTGSYQNFIEETGSLYAQVLEGKKHSEMRIKGEAWSYDQPRSFGIGHENGVIQMLHKMGIIPTLITGSPLEAIQGYRSIWGIEERSYALECDVKNDIYTGSVKYNTGLSKHKAGVMNLMAKQGHQVIFAMGDQFSDGPLIRGALSPQKCNAQKDVYGAAILIEQAQSEVADNYQVMFAQELLEHRFSVINTSTYSSREVILQARKLIRRAAKDPVNANCLTEEQIQAIFEEDQAADKFRLDDSGF